MFKNVILVRIFCSYKLNEGNNFVWFTAVDSAPRIVPGTK